MVVVPPTMLVKMFGVPEMVRIPDKISDGPNEFSCHGRTFRVKRISRDTWHLRDLAISERSRFGTKKQIAEDVGKVLETGVLPRSSSGF